MSLAAPARITRISPATAGCRTAILYEPGYSNRGLKTAEGLGLEDYGDAHAVDFADEYDDGAIVEAIVDWLENGDYDLVVFVGASMGSSIARMCMDRMDERGIEMETRFASLCGTFDRRDQVMPVRFWSRWLMWPLSTRRFQSWLRRGFNHFVAKLQPEPGVDPNLLREHYAALDGLPPRTRRRQLAFLGRQDCSRGLRHPEIPTVYVRARQLGKRRRHDGLVRAIAAHFCREIFPNTVILNRRGVGHCTFVEEPQKWRTIVADVMAELGVERIRA